MRVCVSDKMALYVKSVEQFSRLSVKTCSIKVSQTFAGGTFAGGLYQVCLRAKFISKADRIIDYRPVPVSPLALESFSIRRFFRDLNGTHAYRYYRHLMIVAVLVFLFLIEEINYVCHIFSQIGKRDVSGFPRNNYSRKILIKLSFISLQCNVIFCQFTACKFPRNDISNVTYRRGDSCRNSSVLNFNARFSIHVNLMAKRL